MLLDYAAELKCTTQRQLVQTGVALVHLPQNLHALLLSLSAQAQVMMNALAAELHDLRTRKRAKEKKRERLGRTKQQLVQATKLIKQAESLNHSISHASIHSSHHSTHEEEKTQEVPDKGDQEKVDRLSEQIRMLKEQMELLAALKGNNPTNPQPTSDSEHATDDETVPAAPALHTQTNTQSVNFDRSSHDFPSIPIASPMFAANVNQSIPIAPPLGDYANSPSSAADNQMQDLDSPIAPVFDVPCAPPMAPPMDDIPAPPTAPSFNQVPQSPQRPVLSEVSNIRSPSLKPMSASLSKPHSMADELAARPPLRSRPRPSVQTRKSSSAQSSNTLAPPVTCYTREIPGSENLSHNDLIKVAAKIKLRRTEIPRSPGGTPARKAPKLGHSGGIDQAMLAHALSIKFRDLRRNSIGSRDDKENDWATD